MELEKQVVSLELAQKLKELGVKQESLFYWSEHTTPPTLWNEDALEKSSFYAKSMSAYSAYTVAELGEMLPVDVTEKRNEEVFAEKAKTKHVQFDFWLEQINDFYGVERRYRCSVGSKQFVEKTEAAARAKMLIYLLENELMTL